MNHELLRIIRVANREFQGFIAQAGKDGAKVVDPQGGVRRLEKVDLRLKQVAPYLTADSRYSTDTPEVAYEMQKYGENLTTLRSVMETLQSSLRAEKARLDNVRANVLAASAWATSLRDIS